MTAVICLPKFNIKKTCPCYLPIFSAEINESFSGKFFIFFAQNIDRGYTLELPRQGGSNEYPQSMF